MASPFSTKSRGKSPFDTPTRPSSDEEDRGAFDFLGNLAGDVKDTAVGLPAGVVQLVREPTQSVKAMGGAMWHTWSPLFAGDFTKFGKQVYDHPLAPLLDIATVFSLGAGGAARGANVLSKAGVKSAGVEKLARVARPKGVELFDPKGERLPQKRQLSDRPGRRMAQELAMHAPQWYTGKRNAARFEHLHNVDMSGRIKATHQIQMTAIMQGAKTITDPETAPRALSEIAGGMYAGLLRHNDAVSNQEAARLVSQGKYRYTTDVRRLDPQANRLMRRAQKEETAWQGKLDKHVEIVSELPAIEKRLTEAQRALEHIDAGRLPIEGAAKQRLLVKGLESRLDKAHKSKAEHDKAVTEIERLSEWRVALENRGGVDYFRAASTSLEDFTHFAATFGTRISTRTEVKAARPKIIQEGRWVDDADRVYIHPVHDAHSLGREAAASASFLGKAYRQSTGLWKTIQLGYTPRTVTNNVVGNWILAAARDNPIATSIGLYDAIRITKGPEAALDAALGGTKRATPFKKNHWMYRYFGDELGNTFKQTLADETGRMPGKLRQGLYPIVHKLSDEPVRMAVISAFLRKSPEVKALKKKGLSTDKAIHRALRANPDLRARASHHSRTTAGDYYTLRPWERTVRDLVPFYLWDRHIVKTTANLVADTPGRVAIAQRLSSLGIESTEEILGELPEFLRGAIPLGKSKTGDRATAFLTHSLNPFATVSELVRASEAFSTGGSPGSALLSQMNPFVTGGIEAATGRSLLTGAERPSYGGIIPTMAVNTALGFPQIRLAEALVTEDTEGTAAGNPRLYARDDRSPLTSLFGIPLRNISLESAAKMAEREKPAKKKKRRKTPFNTA